MTFRQISSFLHLILQIASKIRAAGTKKKKIFKLPKGVGVGREIAFTLCSALLLAHTLYTSKFIVQKMFKTVAHFQKLFAEGGENIVE